MNILRNNHLLQQAKNSLTVILVLLSTFFFSCSSGKKELDENVLARVNNEYLYKSDVEAIFSAYQSSRDSVFMVQSFIDDWIEKQVFLSQAKKNLSVPVSSFDKQVEQYRNALIVHAYENQLVEEHLDTLVTKRQLAEFYERTKNNYPLKENIIRARFAKFPVEFSSGLSEFKDLIHSIKPEDLAKLEDFCLHNSISYYLDFNHWLSFSDLLRDLPVSDSNPEGYLRNNILIEVQDDFFKYFVYIFDHRRVGSIAPLSFEEDNIRNLILIQRKRELINKMRNQFLLQAKDEKLVKIATN